MNYPKCLYDKDGGTIVVQSAEQESAAAKHGWGAHPNELPGVQMVYSGAAKPAPEPEEDEPEEDEEEGPIESDIVEEDEEEAPKRGRRRSG